MKRPRLRNQPESAGDSASGLDASGDDVDVGQIGVGEQLARFSRSPAIDDYARKEAALIEHIAADSRYAFRYCNVSQTGAAAECLVFNARYFGSDFDRLGFFYPGRAVRALQPGFAHRRSTYFAGPAVFLRSSVCERNQSRRSGDDVDVGQAGVGEQRAGFLRGPVIDDYARQTCTA